MMLAQEEALPVFPQQWLDVGRRAALREDRRLPIQGKGSRKSIPGPREGSSGAVALNWG